MITLQKVFRLKSLCLLGQLIYLGDIPIFRYRVFNTSFIFTPETDYFPEGTPIRIFGDFLAPDLLEKLNRVRHYGDIEISILGKNFIFFKNFWLLGSFGIYKDHNTHFLYTTINSDPFEDGPSQILTTEIEMHEIDTIFNFIFDGLSNT